MTLLELKSALRVLQTEVTALRDRVGSLEAKKPEIPVRLPEQAVKSERKMCPHCGVKPNHFFHVKTCQKKNKNNGANKEAGG